MRYLLLLFCLPAFADELEPRILGNTAVMHVYYYAPKTLEVTYVDSYLFKDETACRAAMSAALQIAIPHAGQGDLVTASCVGIHPPVAVQSRQGESTDL